MGLRRRKRQFSRDLRRLLNFLGEGIWTEDVRRTGGMRGFFYQQLRVLVVVGRSLPRGQIPLRAAAMTLATLLALVPGILLAFTLARIYQFLFVTKEGKLGLGAELRMAPILFSWKAWRDQIAFYLLMRRDHPHFTYSNYGPLQFLVYTMLYASLLIISITGIILASPYVSGGLASFGADLLRPIEVWMGGLSNVRAVHRFVMWFFILFTAAHIYMAVWNSIRTGNLIIEGIVSGFKADDVETKHVSEEELKKGKAK